MARMSGAEARRRILFGEALPDGLTVSGHLDLKNCISLAALPDGLTVRGWLDLKNCTSLTALPNGLKFETWLRLEGCASLEALPDELTGLRTLLLDGCQLTRNTITITATLPESVIAALPGRRLRDLLDHRLLRHPDILDAVIVTAEHQEGFADDNVNYLMLTVDRDLGEILRGSRPVVAA